jgi:hypothetical protein
MRHETLFSGLWSLVSSLRSLVSGLLSGSDGDMGQNVQS